MPGSMLFEPVAHPTGRRSCITIVSFLSQTLAVAVALLSPLLRTDALPRLRVAQPAPRATLLTEMPPERRPAAPSRAGISAVTSYAGPIRQPRTIPRGTSKDANAPPVTTVNPLGIAMPGLDTGVPSALWDGQAHLLRLPIRMATPTHVRISQGVMQGYLLERVQPGYPPLARQARVQGTVVLAATINKQGAIENLQVTSGHPMLVAAALDAVRRWRYRPFLLNGEPVDVSTNITVVFSLNDGG
jgi:periplasmic protein TonB